MRHVHLILSDMTALAVGGATAIIRSFLNLIRWGEQGLVDLSESYTVVMKHRWSILRLLNDCVHLAVLMET